jgi:hypothetical protein
MCSSTRETRAEILSLGMGTLAIFQQLIRVRE